MDDKTIVGYSVVAHDMRGDPEPLFDTVMTSKPHDKQPDDISQNLNALNIVQTQLDQLISKFVHDINNPNNFISFNIPILRDYLQKILHIVDRFAEEDDSMNWFGMSYPEFREDLFRLITNMQNGSDRITGVVSEFSHLTDGKRVFKSTSGTMHKDRV